MTTLYKLTDEHGLTHGGTQWGPGVTHYAKAGDGPLCSEYWIHAYLTPELAVLLNPHHANFRTPRLWRADGEIGLRDFDLKVGCKALTVLDEMAVPAVTIEQRVEFAIRCALAVWTDPQFVVWASGWLSREDRSQKAAAEAALAAGTAAETAAETAEATAEATAAAWAAAEAALAAEAAGAAVWAEEAWAAGAAVWAAEAKAAINLPGIARAILYGEQGAVGKDGHAGSTPVGPTNPNIKEMLK